MPSKNPKHRIKNQHHGKMGKKSSEKCYVLGCKSEGKFHSAKTNVENYLSKLKWKLTPESRNSRRVAMCKKHYKAYKKIKKKDEKYKNYSDFQPKNIPKKSKSHAYLE